MSIFDWLISDYSSPAVFRMDWWLMSGRPVFVDVISRRFDRCLHCMTDPPREFDARSGYGFQSQDLFSFAGTITLIISFPLRSFPDILAIFWWLSGKSMITRSDRYHWEAEKRDWSLARWYVSNVSIIFDALIRPICITILYHNLLLFIDIFHI
jgi:hypothetical protein